jgi:hypothetical protein
MTAEQGQGSFLLYIALAILRPLLQMGIQNAHIGGDFPWFMYLCRWKEGLQLNVLLFMLISLLRIAHLLAPCLGVRPHNFQFINIRYCAYSTIL